MAASALAACAESEDSGLPRDPDYVGGSAGASTAGTSSTSGSKSTSGAPSTGTSGSSGASAGGGAGGATAGQGGGGAGGAGAGGAGAGGGGAGGAGGADACPMDANKTEPGKCGCGVPDMDSVQGASCVPLQDAIVHRYSFDTDASDSVGNADGTLQGGATVTAKALVLSGGTNGGYLDLPNSLVSSLSNATFEVWVTWPGGGGEWQRIFDFGSSSMAEGQQGEGGKYLFLSARKLRTAYSSATPPAEVYADSATPLPSGTLTQLAVVVNDTENTLALYMNGDSVAGTTLSLSLSAINDVNNWLGRSQFAADEYFKGTITEFRIYDAALTGPQLKTAFKMGEDTTFLKK